MADLPTFRELYDEAKAEVQGDTSTELNDFQPGSFLDAIAGTAATEARAVSRWIARQMRRAFISTARDDELEFVAVDTFGPDLARRDGESADAYRQRVEAYRNQGLKRGTTPAVVYYAQTIDNVQDAVGEEDLETGITTVTAYVDDDEVDDEGKQDIRDAFFADLDAWRSLASMVNLNIAPIDTREPEPEVSLL